MSLLETRNLQVTFRHWRIEVATGPDIFTDDRTTILLGCIQGETPESIRLGFGSISPVTDTFKIKSYTPTVCSYLRDCLVHFVRLTNTLLKDGESAQDNHVLAVTLPNIHRF